MTSSTFLSLSLSVGKVLLAFCGTRISPRVCYYPAVFNSFTPSPSASSRLAVLLSPPPQHFPAETQGVPWDIDGDDTDWEECAYKYDKVPLSPLIASGLHAARRRRIRRQSHHPPSRASTIRRDSAIQAASSSLCRWRHPVSSSALQRSARPRIAGIVLFELCLALAVGVDGASRGGFEDWPNWGQELVAARAPGAGIVRVPVPVPCAAAAAAAAIQHRCVRTHEPLLEQGAAAVLRWPGRY
ncbi:hypothetical protein C8R47DRAFT_1080398 [Mycena vitilis]|nr:hypothetical protein C8R47DRAFT_1080398 [Mycena vitilis]